MTAGVFTWARPGEPFTFCTAPVNCGLPWGVGYPALGANQCVGLGDNGGVGALGDVIPVLCGVTVVDYACEAPAV